MCNNAFYPHPVSYFQLRLSGVVACSDLIVSMVLLSDLIHWKLEDITSVVLEELTASCAECGISNDITDDESSPVSLSPPNM